MSSIPRFILIHLLYIVGSTAITISVIVLIVGISIFRSASVVRMIIEITIPAVAVFILLFIEGVCCFG